MALPTSYLSPADQAALARKVGVTLPDGRVYRNGRIISAQDAANSAATRARDAAFTAQTGENPVRNGVNPNVAGQQAFDAYMGAVNPGAARRTVPQPTIQTVPSTPIATPESAAAARGQMAGSAVPMGADAPLEYDQIKAFGTTSVGSDGRIIGPTYLADPSNSGESPAKYTQRMQMEALGRDLARAPKAPEPGAITAYFAGYQPFRVPSAGSPSFFEQPAMFKDGGYTGPGAPSKPAGIVHAGEFVIPADKVKEIGVRKLDAYFGTDSTKPKTEFQEGGMAGVDQVAAELLSYQGLIPGRNITPETVAAATPQQRLTELASAKREFARINGEQALARQEATWQRNEQARIAREERRREQEEIDAVRQVRALEGRLPELQTNAQRATEALAQKQDTVNRLLSAAVLDSYNGLVSGRSGPAPAWMSVPVVDEYGAPTGTTRLMDANEFAGMAQRDGTPANAVLTAAIQGNTQLTSEQAALGALERNARAAAQQLQTVQRTYEQLIPVAAPRLAQESEPAPADTAAPASPMEQFFVQGQPVSREAAERAQVRQAQIAAGDQAVAAGVNPGGAANVSSGLDWLPQGSVAYQARDGRFVVNGVSFASEEAARQALSGESQVQPAPVSGAVTGPEPLAPAVDLGPINQARAQNAAGRARGGATPVGASTAPAPSAAVVPALAPQDAALVARSLPPAEPVAMAPYFEVAPQRPAFTSPEALGDVNRGRLLNFFASAGDVFRPRIALPGADPGAPDAQLVLPPEVLLERARRFPVGSPDRMALEARAASVAGALEGELMGRQIRQAVPRTSTLPATAYFAGPQA